MHAEAREFVRSCLTGYWYKPHVLEIGSRNVNGIVCDLIPAYSSYVGLDTYPGPGVTEIGDGAEYDPMIPPDIIICCEVLEHTKRAEEICKNIVKILAMNGIFIITCAGPKREPHGNLGGELGVDEYYRNITLEDILKWFNDHIERYGKHTVKAFYGRDGQDLYILGGK